MKTARRQKLRPLSDTEEKAIQTGIAKDNDNPEWTDADFARARPAPDVLPPGLYRSLVRNTRRRQAQEEKRKLFSLRLDPEVVERFRSTGPGWQGRVNQALRKAVGLK